MCERRERKEGLWNFDPPFFLEAYLAPVTESTCVLRTGMDMVSLAGRVEAPDHPLRLRCLVHASLCAL